MVKGKGADRLIEDIVPNLSELCNGKRGWEVANSAAGQNLSQDKWLDFSGLICYLYTVRMAVGEPRNGRLPDSGQKMNEIQIIGSKPAIRRKPRRKEVPWRTLMQSGFALLNIYLGWRFYQFVHAARTTDVGPLPLRPPGVEGWLPISGLMGFINWISAGHLNSVHPAATIILLAFVTIALLFRKAFCAWLCPVGALSEIPAGVGRKFFGRNFKPPRALDRALMSIKYVLLGFFLWAFYLMGTSGISAFIASPYNQVADVKMLLFFLELGTTGAVILLGLAVGSMFIQGFWCRYLCPYGAFLGFFSWMSPVKVRRNAISCIDCGKCDKVCPVRLPVMNKLNIQSVECTACMECVTICPVQDTLDLGTRRHKLSPLRLAILILIVFTAFYAGARVLGAWTSSLTDEQYRYHISHLNSSDYGHPGMK
jgi:polyferredoxin